MDACIDVAAMNAGVPHTNDDVMADDGTGTVTEFLVDDFRRVRVEDSAVSKFDSGESNAVLWRNVWMNKDCALICFWQDRAATVPNKGSSATLAKDICVVQNKEPRHFLAVFADRFIVHDGRDPRATAVAQQANKEQKKERLCQVAGSNAVHAHAVEKTHADAELLNPNSVFVVVDCARKRGFVCAGGQTSTRSTQRSTAFMDRRARTPRSRSSPWTPQSITVVCTQPSATPSHLHHVPCPRVVQFEEPITFSTNFHGWQDKPPAAATKNGILCQNRVPTQSIYDGKQHNGSERRLQGAEQNVLVQGPA